MSNPALKETGRAVSRGARYLVLNRATPYRRSYVNDAVEVLKLAGRSMKLQELQTTIGDKRGKRVSLGSLKVCLSRYVDTNDSSKLLTRLAPGLFGLSEWVETGHGCSGIATRQSSDRSNSFSSVSGQRTYGFSGSSLSSVLPDPATLSLFLWTMPADEQTGMPEQRVYIRAIDPQDAIERLQFAGVENASRGTVAIVKTVSVLSSPELNGSLSRNSASNQ